MGVRARGTTYKSVINSDPKNVRSLVRNGVKMGQTCGASVYGSRCSDTTRLLSMPIYDFFLDHVSLPRSTFPTVRSLFYQIP